MDYTELTVAERLKIAIKASGIKQKALAKKVGIHADTLSRIVRGEVEGGFDKIAAIANELDLNVHWIATGNGHMNATPVSHDYYLNTRVRGTNITTTGNRNTYKVESHYTTQVTVYLVQGLRNRNTYKVESHYTGEPIPIDPKKEKKRIAKRDQMLAKFEALNDENQESIILLVDRLYSVQQKDRSQQPE